MKIKRHKLFLKDFKKTTLNDREFEKFVCYINTLRTDEALPAESLDHSLSGNYKDCREFHLSGDMLVIYLVNQNDEIVLMRLGTHSQLF
jgi:mRNA interferase YafQ